VGLRTAEKRVRLGPGYQVAGGKAHVRPRLARLEATVARTFADSVDLDRANTADPQGIGGRTGPS